MGLFDRHRERQHEHEVTAWAERRNQAALFLDQAQNWHGEPAATADVGSIVLRGKESVYLVLEGAGLIEARHGPGHYSGGSQGVSFHIAKGVNYRLGAQRGTFVSGPEESTLIDTGVVVVTSDRVVFAGAKQTREWAFAKLVGFTHSIDSPWTAVQVSNRQKTSGFSYTSAVAETVHFRLELAIANFNGTTERIVADLQRQLSEVTQAQPAEQTEQATTKPAALASAPLPPAGWFPDPERAGLWRYWDGTQWTEQRSGA